MYMPHFLNASYIPVYTGCQPQVISPIPSSIHNAKHGFYITQCVSGSIKGVQKDANISWAIP